MQRARGVAELRDRLAAHATAPLLVTDVADELATDEARAVPTGSVFLNCALDHEVVQALTLAGAAVVNAAPTPYDQDRRALYTSEELFAGFDPVDPCTYCDTLDARIYQHWIDTGRSRPNPVEALGRRMHDHHITEAMGQWLGERQVVAIMGGHDLSRATEPYRDVVVLARTLTRRGFTIATGGGPGAMEAAHLGAALAALPNDALPAALALLAPAPTYQHVGWLPAAFAVRDQVLATAPVKPAHASIGIPTWHYGHEPPTPFATVIAKYFENSVREDGLVTIAERGIVFAPGSAGTVQEIFQDGAQNHYGTVDGLASPMVLMGVDFWTRERPVAPLLTRLATGRPYAGLIEVSDDIDDIVEFLVAHEPVPVPGSDWSFCTAHCRD